MVDFNSKAKHRLKLTKLVEERKQKTGEDEATAKKVVMKELRQKMKGNKELKHKEAEKIKQDVEASMEGSDKKAIEKAVRKAVAKHFSQMKKAKNCSLIFNKIFTFFFQIILLLVTRSKVFTILVILPMISNSLIF